MRKFKKNYIFESIFNSIKKAKKQGLENKIKGLLKNSFRN
jgi:hypothetical protein